MKGRLEMAALETKRRAVATVLPRGGHVVHYRIRSVGRDADSSLTRTAGLSPQSIAGSCRAVDWRR